MSNCRRKILFVQLPIPQPGMEPARGNIPLAAGYLQLHAQKQGLEDHFALEIFPIEQTNTFGDSALVQAILSHKPWLVGFTCYLWNIDRTLWIAERLKALNPQLRVVLGGPEITADNRWVLEHPAVDFAAIGEGEQTFTELLQELRLHPLPPTAIAGLYVTPAALRTVACSGTNDNGSPFGTLPLFRTPLPKLDVVSSPYLTGILDAADEEMLFLETIRGCIFKCKFCYYPKSYDDLYFLSREKIIANLQHARDRGAREVVLLDPTLNQRKDFAGFLRLLAECNADRQFTYFGELRAEGITEEIARLLREANFTEVEIGLQSIDPLAQELMDRKNHLRSFERGARALLDVGIKVKVDLIIGLPGDTVDSVRRGMCYVRDSGLYSQVQVFNLAILPGTAFRQEAEQLGLEFQSRPPYYVLRTSTLKIEDLYELMQEAQDLFETEFDPLPAPELQFTDSPVDADQLVRQWKLDFDLPGPQRTPAPGATRCAQAFTLWFRGRDLRAHRDEATRIIIELLTDNPHSTLQIVLEPVGNPHSVNTEFLESLRGACLASNSYLDRYYCMSLGRMKGAKRLVVLLPLAKRDELGQDWISDIGEYAAILWREAATDATSSSAMELVPDSTEEELEEHEYVLAYTPGDGEQR